MFPKQYHCLTRRPIVWQQLSTGEMSWEIPTLLDSSNSTEVEQEERRESGDTFNELHTLSLTEIIEIFASRRKL